MPLPSLISPEAASPWLTKSTCEQGCRIRLVVFPHAGGGPAAYSGWRAVAPDIDARFVCLPGREARVAERALADLRPIVTGIGDALATLDSSPLVLFGHSLGALIAFEVAHLLQARGDRRLRGLIVSGAAAPQAAVQRPQLRALDDAALLHALATQYGGVAPEVLHSPELVAFFAPVVRADIALFETYTHTPRPLLTTPTLALAGESDGAIEVGAVHRWSELVSGIFEFIRVRGDHFFVKTAEAEVQRIVLSFCRRLGIKGR